jgi:hypothetical protein
MSLPRPLTIGVTALLTLGAVATGAAAQDVSSVGVLAEAAPGSRQFFVEDLAGAPLTQLDLGTSGQSAPFQTRVADDGFTGTAATFRASAEMTKLYKVTADVIDYSTEVDSDKISVSYTGVPTDVAGVSLGAVPKIQVAGLLPKCNELSGLLPAGSSLLDSGGLLGGVLSTLGLSDLAIPLCNALGGALSLTPVPIEAADGVLVTLDETVIQPALNVVGQLPVTVAGSSEAGAFTNPSFLGDGAGDTRNSATAATKRALLVGTPNGTLDLDALVSGLLDGVPLFPSLSAPGEDSLTTVSAVVASLQSSSDLAVTAVGNALFGLTAADQTGVLSGLTGLTAGTPVATLADTVLQRISGTYRSFPRLTADLTGAASGTYTGTMTVTFVQE